MSVFATVTTHRELVENLTMREIKSRYKQSVLGYTWAVANPFIFAVIYTVLSSYILKIHTAIATPISAYYGLLFWNLFATGVSAGTESLVGNLSLITKIYFPREVFPFAAVMSKLVDFGFGLIGLIPLLFWFHLAPSFGMLLIIPLLLILLVFTTGVGMLCACANLFYRDVRQLVGLALGILIYFVPNFYDLSRVPPAYRTIYLLDPVATVIEAARRATFPQAGSVGELLPFVAASSLVALTVFFVGFATFKHYEARFAEFI